MFSLPSLHKFVGARDALTFHSAELQFKGCSSSLVIDPLDKCAGADTSSSATHPLHLQVKVYCLDRQASAILQICSVLAPLLARTESLKLGHHSDGPSDPEEAEVGLQGGYIAVGHVKWQAFLRIFSSVKTLQIANRQIEHRDLLIDGYISHMFGPLDAEKHHATLLRREPQLIQWYSIPIFPGIFFAESPTEPGFDQELEPESWAIDYVVKDMGVVIPQQRWAPRPSADAQRYIHHQELCPPIFFLHEDGESLGLPLVEAACGECSHLQDAMHAAAISSITYTQICINVRPVLTFMV
jgi:hypothetical protein